MSRRGAAGLTTVLAVAAFVLTAGFLYWLHRSSAELEERVEPALEEEGGEEGLPVLTVNQLAADPAAAAGSRAAVLEAEVSARLGRAVFTLRLADTLQYPVLLSRDLIQRETEVYGGDVVSAWGQVYSLNDSIRGVWVEAGAVDEGQRQAIPAAASFLLADSLDVR